jgi:hypothetical protein
VGNTSYLFVNNSFWVTQMILLFCKRKSKTEKEIIEILKSYGGAHISDREIVENNNTFTIISFYKVSDLNIRNGIAVFCDDTEKFLPQTLPQNIIGICEDSNKTALTVFQKSGIPVISCGMNAKNTITLSSLGSNQLFASLQRCVTDSSGLNIEPAEFKIKLNSKYQPFSVMASVAILLLNSIKPNEF